MRQDYTELAGLWKNDNRQALLPEDSIRTTASLDMRSVLKASQAISEELELEGILKKLIYSLLECAGAQHIYYLSQTDSGYEIQSEGHSGAKDVCIVSKRPAKDWDIPLSIVSYAERTLEAVILEDGENSRVYGKDIHIKEMRGSDIVSRMGGDEFVLLLSRIIVDEEIRDVCERILSEIRQPFQLSEDLFVEMTASIGVSVYPRDGQDEKELLSRADQAMYRIKKSDKNYYTFTKPLSEAKEKP